MLGESLGLKNNKLTQDSKGLQTIFIFAFHLETFPESDYREMPFGCFVLYVYAQFFMYFENPCVPLAQS